MKDEDKSKEQLLQEVKELRLQLWELEQSEKSRSLMAQNLLKEKILSEAVIESLPGIFYIFDTQGKMIRWNEALENITRYSTEEIACMQPLDFFAGEDRKKTATAISQAFAEGKTTVEADLVSKDNGKIPYLLSGNRITLDGQDYLVGLGIDITKRRRLEEAFRDLFFYAPIGIYIVQKRKLRLVNPGFQKITGYSEKELLGNDCLNLATPEYKDKIRVSAVDMLKGKTTTPYEYQFQTKGGEIRWAMESVTTTSFNGKKASIGYFMDITERKRLENQLTQSQRMEAVGILAGGIAHDFNNLLTAIMGYGELMKMDLDKNDPHYHYNDEIMKTATRGSTLTHQLLAFSRKQILQPSVLSINNLVSSMEKLLRRLIGEDIELVTRIAPELGAVRADKGQIEQIIMNLAVNARDAMPYGGKLTIETSNALLDETYGRTHLDVAPGRYVMLAVSDNGLGMDAATQAHIFEPFFTTKTLGQGTGLGLATVYGIVKQSGGHIWVYSEEGQGTTFKIYLPQVEEAVTVSGPKTVVTTQLKGSETILVVEDDDTLRNVIARGLKKYGYKVLTAANGGEALMTCEKKKGPIHLLLTDVILPQMGGRELAERLTLLRPDMKVLYMSGYTENAIVHHGILNEDVGFLQKPFKVNAMAQKIREILDTPE
ncbi:MAG: PAS domain S-box protein [Syntrophales bacterium]|nr:PAS domain S-box protein [Syntrophales bacterium]MDD5642302.1 PAS domain S-box protein [Syntrophales bacterium]